MKMTEPTTQDASTKTETCDALVIGAGPAGSTAAAVLADHGHRVIVLEREDFPRYRVGESLLPYCYFTLDRIGMNAKLADSGFTKKYSVQFVTMSGRVSAPFYFDEHFDHPAAQTWQVDRARFDQMMADNASEKGAEYHFGVSAKQLVHDDRGTVVGVNATNADGEPITYRATMTIDATGRDAFATNRNGWRVKDPELNKIAMWTYYRGATRDEGKNAGATTVAYVPEKGWFWYIPLADDRVSVGIVAERDYLYREGKGDPQAILDREIAINPWIASHLSTGEQISDVKVTADYSYRSRYCASDGLVLIGDAFGFLDPVFSSGVFLALISGEKAADAVHHAITTGDVSAAQFEPYSEHMREGIEGMRRLVYAFYDESFSFGKLLKKYPQLQGDTTDCLIGHLWKDLDPLFHAVAEFAEVPAPLPHGRPLTPATAAVS